MSGGDTFSTPASSYDRLVGRYSPQLAGALMAFGDIARPMRALDVGCGPGALATALARVLGPENVAAADPSEPFVVAAAERLPGVEVVQAGAESLPFADDAFDAVLSQLVVNFIPDAEVGVREMARVTTPGGTVVACVWDYAGEMTLLRAFWDAALEVDTTGAAAADEAAVMRWCREGELAELWSAAGLSGIRTAALVVSANYTDFADLWDPFTLGFAPSGAYLATLAPEAQAALRAVLQRRLGVGDDPFELSARAWAVSGTLPATGP